MENNIINIINKGETYIKGIKTRFFKDRYKTENSVENAERQDKLAHFHRKGGGLAAATFKRFI